MVIWRAICVEVGGVKGGRWALDLDGGYGPDDVLGRLMRHMLVEGKWDAHTEIRKDGKERRYIQSGGRKLKSRNCKRPLGNGIGIGIVGIGIGIVPGG